MAKLLILLALVFGTACAVPLSKFFHEERIAGGANAPDGEYPHQISLRTIANSHFCGGSIISSNWILTAAHCVHNLLPASMMIVVGTNQLNSGGTAYGVSQIIAHFAYDPQNNQYDIALLRAQSYIGFGPKVKLISLASSNPSPGTPLILSGWGFTSYPLHQLSNSLQHIGLTSISLVECQAAFPFYPVFNSNLCTYQNLGGGACEGDFGGPLISGNVQVGIASWGLPCGKSKPDVFTSVAHYRSWIRSASGV